MISKPGLQKQLFQKEYVLPQPVHLEGIDSKKMFGQVSNNNP